MIIYPAIDLIGGRCVRLYKGRFDETSVYGEDPVERARSYRDQGARFLHLVDLDGAKAGAPAQADLVAKIADLDGLSVQVGGGVRSMDAAKALVEAGAERIVIGSLAARDRQATLAILDAIGAGRIALAVDVRLDKEGVPRVSTDGWRSQTSLDARELIAAYAKEGVKTVLCTDIDRDGTMEGPNGALYRELQEACPAVEIQASGGIGSLEDLSALKAAGTRGVIVGKALFEGRFTLEEALLC